MTPDKFQEEIDKQAQDQEDKAEDQAEINAVVNAGNQISKTTAIGAQKIVSKLDNVKGSVEITNNDLAKSEDVSAAVDAINKLNLTTFMNNEGLPKMAENIDKLTSSVQQLQSEYENKGLKAVS